MELLTVEDAFTAKESLKNELVARGLALISIGVITETGLSLLVRVSQEDDLLREDLPVEWQGFEIAYALNEPIAFQ